MKNLKDLKKEEMGRKLFQVKKEILEISTKLDKSVAIPMLLCLEDAVSNCQLKWLWLNQVKKDFLLAQKVFPLINIFFNRIYKQINDSIISILSEGFLGYTKNLKLLNIIFEISLNQNIDNYVLELVTEGKIEKKDPFFQSEEPFYQYNLVYVVILKKWDIRTRDSFDKIIILQNLFAKKHYWKRCYICPKKQKTTPVKQLSRHQDFWKQIHLFPIGILILEM